MEKLIFLENHGTRMLHRGYENKCSEYSPFTSLNFYFLQKKNFFMATPAAYESSRARGRIGTTAAGLPHSHSNARS